MYMKYCSNRVDSEFDTRICKIIYGSSVFDIGTEIGFKTLDFLIFDQRPELENQI